MCATVALVVKHAKNMHVILLSSLASVAVLYFSTESRKRYDFQRKLQNKMCRLFSSYKLNAHSLYSITIYMLHYNPQHVSSSTLLIFRRTNCIITASGIVSLCKQPYSMPTESGLQSALNRHTVRLFTKRVTIPEAVIIQFVLLKMSKVLLETC